MLKRRLIPVLNILNGLIVRSESFSYHQNIGNIIDEARRYNEWDVDELIYLDISRIKEYDLRRDDYKIKNYTTIAEIITEISKVCFMPLTFGGGLRTLEDIDFRIKNGADKVTLNTGAFLNPELIKIASKKYGSQCIVISIDYKTIDGKPTVFTEFGKNNTNTDLFEWMKRCEKMGAGEFFINSIERDGEGKGYDIETIARCVESTKLPVIACGGAGTIEHFIELAKETGVSAIAAGNMFHFTERSYPRAKKRLKEVGINVR